MSDGWQAPVRNEKAEGYAALWQIITHPAFRLGFLDAQSGRQLDHEYIIKRIQAETPKGALKRLGWDAELFSANDVQTAQYRYEEGRLAVMDKGIRCKAWGHPDFPPAKLRAYIDERSGIFKQSSR